MKGAKIMKKYEIFDADGTITFVEVPNVDVHDIYVAKTYIWQHFKDEIKEFGIPSFADIQIMKTRLTSPISPTTFQGCYNTRGYLQQIGEPFHIRAVPTKEIENALASELQAALARYIENALVSELQAVLARYNATLIVHGENVIDVEMHVEGIGKKEFEIGNSLKG